MNKILDMKLFLFRMRKNYGKYMFKKLINIINIIDIRVLLLINFLLINCYRY